MKNSIAERVNDFLKNFPPFDKICKNELLAIAKEVKIIYLEKNSFLFKQGDEFNSNFYVVKEGAIKLYTSSSDGQQKIADMCDKGDIFGLRPLINQENYKLNAIANEESIIYAIPIDLFQKASENNPDVSKYLITSFASNSYDPYTVETRDSIFRDYIPENNLDIANLQTANYTKKAITCSENATLQEAAILMSEKKIGCIIIVNSEKHPLGMITNSDIKNKIATGEFPIDTSVKNIMSSPVVTFSKKITIAEAQLQMVKNSIGNICITKDGTPNSKTIGILTHHDILVSLGSNPSVLLKEIKRAKKIKKLRETRIKVHTLLKKYIEQSIPISHILTIISEINDAITKRVIELALKKIDQPPPCKFAWLTLGSQGRKEQLLYTDQDNALIYEDVYGANSIEVKKYFLELANIVTLSLHKIGYEYCPAEMMASNPEWCKSLSEWKAQFAKWILDTDEKAVLLSSVFFDFNNVYGDQKLTQELTASIHNTLEKTSVFYSTLSQDAIKSASPLGFFKQFLVEENGDHKDFFNLKNRAMMPLIDAARVLILIKKVGGINNTVERFEKLVELEPQNKEVFESCALAFKALLKYRTKYGILNNDSGKFIELETLSKEEKLRLKRCFNPIREIQNLIKNRLQMGNFK